MKARFVPGSVSSAVLIVAAGCSGGGGGSSVGGADGPPADLVEITDANAKAVAAGAMLSALEGGNFAPLAVPETVGIDAATTTKTTPLYSKVSGAQAEQDGALARPGSPVGSEAPVGPTTIACDFGGSATLSGEVGSPETVSPGDTVSLTFDECDDGSAIVDGTFSMTVVSFSGNLETGAFSLSVTVELGSLRIVEAGETVAADGDASLTIDATRSPTVDVVLSSDSLSIDAEGRSHSLTDYSFAESVDTLTGDYSVEASGAVASSAFEGVAEFETVETFVGFAAEHPHIGELLITGANGATIRAAALDSEFVRITVDTDGDGAADFTQDYTWEELTAP